MSNVSNTHNVCKLEKNSKALTGQRMARVIAKKSKTGEYESSNLIESKFVSVPMIAPEFSQDQMAQLAPHIVGMLNDAQDALIRECIIRDGATSINEAQIDFAACIAYLDDSAKGNRVTSEYMQKWFMDTYAEPAMEFICELVKFDKESLSTEQMTVVEQKTAILRDMFAGFASGKYSPDIPKCKAIRKFGAFLGEENYDGRMQVIIEKTAKIQEEKEKELSMDALGF